MRITMKDYYVRLRINYTNINVRSATYIFYKVLLCVSFARGIVSNCSLKAFLRVDRT